MRFHIHKLGYRLYRPWLVHNGRRAIGCAVSQPFSTIEVPSISHLRVPVGLNGSVNLHIRRATRPSQLDPILIYLPPGPNLPTTCSSIASLPFSLPATIVSIDYRASPEQRYPLPIHDVLAGYDWILKHLVHGVAARNDWHSAPIKSPSVAVCGELLGGSLAAMLALTECHAFRPGGIQAVVLGNPIVDWTAMYPFPAAHKEMEDENTSQGRKEVPDMTESTINAKKPKNKSRSPPKMDAWTSFPDSQAVPSRDLLRIRDMLFKQAEDYHDPFASPLLFFRTASQDIVRDEISDIQSSTIPLLEFIRKRRAHRRYPPLGSGLVLPRCRVDVGRKSVLRDQGVEFVEALQRSISVYEGTRRRQKSEAVIHGQSRLVDAELREVDGEGLWGEEDMVGIMDWMERAVSQEAIDEGLALNAE